MKRYESFDVLRGVAALAVVLFHLGTVKLQPRLMPHGYLAVDFFFILSGFVIAHAYGNALGNRMGWTAFAMKRLVRLYPLALMGAALGTSVLLLKWVAAPDKVDSLGGIVVSGVLNGLVLPDPFSTAASRYELFPGNGPLWTLSFEIMINLAWAAWAFRWRTSSLSMLVVLGGIAVAASAVRAGTLNIGFDLMTVSGGVARVVFGFSLGILIHRWRNVIPDVRFPLGTPALSLALVAAMACPEDGFGLGPLVWDLLCLFVVMPAIVMLASRQDARHAALLVVGEISYPLYILHFPLIALVSGLHQGPLSRVGAPVTSAVAVAVAVATALVVSRWYDVPVRRRLGRLTFRASSPNTGRASPRTSPTTREERAAFPKPVHGAKFP